MRFIILLIFLYLSMFADMNFKETRYMAALDFEKSKYGNLHMDNENLIINYTKPIQETISYYNDKITVLAKDKLDEYSFQEHPNAQYLGLILKAILNNNYATVDELFEIKKEKQEIQLKAKPIIYSYIESINIIKHKKSIKNIIIYMTNKDKITIETIN